MTFLLNFLNNMLKINELKHYFRKQIKTIANADFQFDNHYLECKNNLEQIYQGKANGIKIRSKCDCYEFGEKLRNFSLT